MKTIKKHKNFARTCVPVIATNCIFLSSFNFNGYDTKPLILFVNRNAVLSIKVVNRLKIMKYAVRNWGGGGYPHIIYIF